MAVRNSPKDVRRDKGERSSWCEEEKREAAVRGVRVQARWPHRYPGGGENGEGGQGIRTEKGKQDLSGCRGGGEWRGLGEKGKRGSEGKGSSAAAAWRVSARVPKVRAPPSSAVRAPPPPPLRPRAGQGKYPPPGTFRTRAPGLPARSQNPSVHPRPGASPLPAPPHHRPCPGRRSAEDQLHFSLRSPRVLGPALGSQGTLTLLAIPARSGRTDRQSQHKEGSAQDPGQGPGRGHSEETAPHQV